MPLLDPCFDLLLRERYPEGVGFVVNGAALAGQRRPESERAPLEIRIGRRRKPSAVGYLVRDSLPLGEEERGVAVSTLGKVIRRGWDWLGISAATPEIISGAIEAPALAECLTLNKADFIRTGPRGATYLTFRKAIQEAVSRQLAEWGDARDKVAEARRRVTRPIERDLENVLIDLADDFPLLGSLVERRVGGQRRLPIGQPASDGRELVAASIVTRTLVSGEGVEEAAELEIGPTSGSPTVAAIATSTAMAESPAPDSKTSPDTNLLSGTTTARRPARYGLSIQIETRSDDSEMARLVESTVWVNDSHPAYRRAVASRCEGYHVALSVAMALAPLAVEPADHHAFVSAFLARWGAALGSGRKRPTRP